MGKVVLITGSSRGIGRSIAIKFAKEGYSVIINGLNNKEALEIAKSEIESYHVPCLAFLGDVGDYEQANILFQLIQSQFGTLDILINNAGISHIGLFTDMTPELWNRLITTNINSVLNCCHNAVPMFLKKNNGKIINISSVWGAHGASCEAVYSATKGAVNSFTGALARELAPSNIQVNAIACGAVDTEMNQCFSEEELMALKEEIPCGRMATPTEVADFVYDLCKGHSYLTGQVIQFDGGWI